MSRLLRGDRPPLRGDRRQRQMQGCFCLCHVSPCTASLSVASASAVCRRGKASRLAHRTDACTFSHSPLEWKCRCSGAQSGGICGGGRPMGGSAGGLIFCRCCCRQIFCTRAKLAIVPIAGGRRGSVVGAAAAGTASGGGDKECCGRDKCACCYVRRRRRL